MGSGLASTDRAGTPTSSSRASWAFYGSPLASRHYLRLTRKQAPLAKLVTPCPVIASNLLSKTRRTRIYAYGKFTVSILIQYDTCPVKDRVRLLA
eukprot:IDg1447t1